MPASLTSASLNYNFGSLYRRLLPSVYVSNGGRLYVNNAGLPVSGGTPATQANPVEANFEMYTSNCGTLVQLWPDGQLVLGQPNSDKKATVRFANKSVLDMRWAGQTIVNAGSTLVIQRRATLLVRDGGILNIYGTVIVEAGAYVCFERYANVNVQAGGRLTIDPAANQGGNPASNLGPLPCVGPPIPATSCATPYVSLRQSALNDVCVGSTVEVTAAPGNGAVLTNWRIENGQESYRSGNTLGVWVTSPGTK